MNSLDELILKWQEGSLTTEELRQLNTLLDRGENRQVLLEEFMLSAGLRQACSESIIPRPENIVPMPKPAIRQAAWRWVAAAAACAAIIGIVARLSVGTPDLALLGGNGQKVAPGEFVRTSENQETEIKLDRGETTILLRGGSSFEVLALEPQKRFRLHSGALVATVAPQREPMLIRTPQAEAVVLGTEFVLSTLPHSTRLDVSSGTVRLLRAADGHALTVRGNEFATVAPDVEFAPLPHPPAPWKNEDIGQVEMHGSAFVEGGRCLIKGSGRNTCLKKDQLHFLYQKIAGDFEFQARLVSFTARSASARAGLMVRRSLETACRQAFVAFRGDLQVEIQSRPATETKELVISPSQLPVWLRVARTGDTLSFAISRDNATWQTLASEQIEFGEHAFVGLAVTSFDNEVLDESLFDQITASSSLGSNTVRLASEKR